MKCKTCGNEISAEVNFCRFCGAKQNAICNCWLKKEPYDCGQEKCPGYKLFELERDREG